MPAENRKCCFELLACMLVVKSSAFTRATMDSKQYGDFLVCITSQKIKGFFFKAGRMVFIIVINTSCSGICYAIHAQQNFLHYACALFEFLPGINNITNALTVGIYSYNIPLKITKILSFSLIIHISDASIN